MFLKISVLPLFILILFNNVAVGGETEAPVAIGVDYKWDASSSCTAATPEIKLKNVPTQTKKLQFSLRDLDRGSDHGSGEIVYVGDVIAKGAVEGIRGPCPPIMESHRYKLTVTAIDKDKNKIAEGSATESCCR